MKFRSDLFKGEPYRQEKCVAIAKSVWGQIRVLLLDRGYDYYGASKIESIKGFCEEFNLECPSKGNMNSWMVDLWLNEDFPLIRCSGPRNYTNGEWNRLRKRVLDYYGSKCMKCGDTEKEIQVDHIKPYSIYPQLSLEFDNMQVLCASCNASKSNRNCIDYRPIEQVEK